MIEFLGVTPFTRVLCALTKYTTVHMPPFAATVSNIRNKNGLKEITLKL